MYMPQHRRKCAACRDWFTPARTNVRYCSPACKQRAYRRRRVDPRAPRNLRAEAGCNFDWEHDKEYEHETNRKLNRRAANWQVDEALRLADDFALCRDGTLPSDISRRMLARVRAVAKCWRALASKLKQHKQASR
jgi:hypothetical protein